VNDRDARRALLGIRPPDEVGAQRRSWQLARAAFEEREPTPWPVRHARPLLAAAAGIALLAAVLSPPGRAVIGDVRKAIGTERKVAGVPQARPALFSLPAAGRVLVTAPRGAWVVDADGSKRRLGDYDEASWSPRGLHAVVSSRSQLVAVRPNGQVRWTLARPRVHDARWSPSGFRIAYLSGSNLRVVAGDKTGDRRVDGAADVAPAWRPVEEHVLAYAKSDGTVTALETDSNETLWTAPVRATPVHLEWSADGRRLLAAVPLSPSRFALTVYDEAGRRLQSLAVPGGFQDAAFAPDDHRIALVRRSGTRSELLIVDGDLLRRQEPVFAGQGTFSDVVWSPAGRWLLLGWESADQWLFIRSTAVEKIKAISSLASQFDPGGTGAGPFPRIEGWCCAEPK
jgi:dipeptidyl aminopeptidase/acylaminoacyl peptidase